MKKSLILLSLVFLFSCNQNEQKITNSAIINGVAPTEEEGAVLSTVSISLVRQVSHCTGVLISPKVVLTAAHCIYPDSLFVVKNGLDANFTAEDQSNVKEVIVHPQYKDDEYVADIAIMILKEPLAGQVATLFEGDEIKEMIPLVVAGYSLNSYVANNDIFSFIKNEERPVVEANIYENNDGSYSQKLLFRSVSTMDTKSLEWDDYTPESDKFVFLQNNGGICNGDSGGPAFIKLNGGYYLYGIHASVIGDENTLCRSVGIGTKVQFYQTWILETLKQRGLEQDIKFKKFNSFEEVDNALDEQEKICSNVNFQMLNYFDESDISAFISSTDNLNCTKAEEFLEQSAALSIDCHMSCPDSGTTKEFCAFFDRGIKRVKDKFKERCM